MEVWFLKFYCSTLRIIALKSFHMSKFKFFFLDKHDKTKRVSAVAFFEIKHIGRFQLDFSSLKITVVSSSRGSVYP